MVMSVDSSLGTPPLAEAIERHPLIVTPDTSLMDAIALMHETATIGQTSPRSGDVLCGARSSCVLVMQDKKLQGIFTERV